MTVRDATFVDAGRLLATAIRHLGDDDPRRPIAEIPTLDEGTSRPFRPFAALAIAIASHVITAWDLPTFQVEPGSPFRAVLTGTGNPDLYVRWGAAPTTTQYDCRPYLPGASETCDLTVPAGTTSAFVMISSRSFWEAKYSAAVTWTEP